MNILLLDNYDSFTYNIAHYLRELTGSPIPVIRNDQIRVEEVDAYDAIVLSPGPGLPADAGIMHDLIFLTFHRYITELPQPQPF
jgi:anthranilate synthase component 2